MTAAILTIGDEILIGQIVDTNSGFIAKSLDAIGIEISTMVSIADDKSAILKAFENLQDRVDLVIITGGLGPTKDDITKKTFCDYFDDNLVVDQKVLDHVTYLIEKVYQRPISQINKDQALVPSKCTVLFNSNGTAPGMWIKKSGTVFISLPGVPYEMKGILTDLIVPKLVAEFHRDHIVHKTIMTYGVGESLLAEQIEDWENNLGEIKLAYLPSPGRVRLRLSARGKDLDKINANIAEKVLELQGILGNVIVGFDEGESLEFQVGKLLVGKGFSLSTAESCTGGKIAQMLTDRAGASQFFKGSIVAYNEKAKIDLLSVLPQTIETFSVVSAKVAEEMAMNVAQLLGSDYAIATTGNAGPTKDVTHQDIGVAFIAIKTPTDIIVERFDFGQPREKFLLRAANKSLEMLRKEILKNDEQ